MQWFHNKIIKLSQNKPRLTYVTSVTRHSRSCAVTVVGEVIMIGTFSSSTDGGHCALICPHYTGLGEFRDVLDNHGTEVSG
jgi:hypothetical protein